MKFVIFLLLLSETAFSQNLIPNSGFEDTTGCPGANVSLSHLKHWSKLDNHFGSPDQYYSDCDYNGLKNSMAPGQKPFNGKGYAGSFCYGSNLREYMKVPLTYPMIKDSIYRIDFFVLPAGGYGTFIDSYGVHFSIKPPSGRDSKSLKVINLQEHIGNPRGELINDTVQWTRISGNFKAQGGELFATFGNFRSDSETEHELFKLNAIVANRSYMLIDGVQIDLASNASLIDNTNSHGEFKNAEVIPERELIITNEFTSSKNNVTITIWDHMKKDNDSLNLILNNTLLLDHFLLSKQRHKIKLQLEPGEHLIKLHALNLGETPPNTAAIKVSDGKKRKLFILRSDLKSTECLKIIINE